MKAEFDEYARDYERLLKDPIRERFASGSDFFHWRKWILLQRVLKNAGLSAENLSWLDIGCGKGELLQFGAPAFREAWGCDPSAEMLRACVGAHTRLQTDSRLPFDDESFDVVTAACVYHHLSAADRPVLTAEARRVLRKGGFFVIFEHNPWNPATRLIVSRTPVDADAELLTARACRRLLREAGLSKPDTAYYLFVPERLFRAASGIESALEKVPFGGQYAVWGRRDS